MSVVGSEGLAARLNYARPSLLIEQVAGVTAATASQWVRVGARTTPRVRIGHTLPPLFPHVADALRDGAIGADTAEAITRDLAAAAPRADVEHLARSGNTPTVSGASPTVIVRVTADVLDTKKGTGQIVGIPDARPQRSSRSSATAAASPPTSTPTAH